MQKSTDVAIVGGGVIGCTIAYYLAKQGIKCTVFEQTRFGHGASSATAGVIGPLWHISDWEKTTMAVGMKSLEMYPALAAELREAGVDPQFQQTGILKIALTDDQVATLKRDLIWQAEAGLGTTWLSADEVLEREPEINPGVLGGVFSPREGSIRGQSLVDSLVNGASRLGATFLEGVEIVGLETSGQRVTGVKNGERHVSRGPYRPCRRTVDWHRRKVGATESPHPPCQGGPYPSTHGGISAQVHRTQLRRGGSTPRGRQCPRE